MKNIILVVFFILSSFTVVKAQRDYCKDITRKIDEMKGDTTYTTPGLSLTDRIFIYKNLSQHLPLVALFISTCKNSSNYNAHGLYIKFNDGTILKYPGKDIDCTYVDSQNGYSYSVLLGFDEDIEPITPFQTKKIVKIQIADKDIDIPDDFATKLKAWATCIVNIK